jgi:hypothetical protein
MLLLHRNIQCDRVDSEQCKPLICRLLTPLSHIFCRQEKINLSFVNSI